MLNKKRFRLAAFALSLIAAVSTAGCRTVFTITTPATVTVTTTATSAASTATSTATVISPPATATTTVTATTTLPATTPATNATNTAPGPNTRSTTTTTAPVPTAPATTIKDPFEAAWDDLAVYRQNLVAAEQTALFSMPGASIYRVEVEIAPDYLSLAGREDIRYTNRETTSLNEIYFQLFPSMTGGKTTISAAIIDNKPATYAYEFGGGSLRVALPYPLPPDGSVTIGLDFKVDIPTSARVNYGLFGYTNGVLALNGFYPAIPAFDESGWHAGPYPPNSDNTFQDAAFYLVRATAPEGLNMAATGTEVASATAGGTRTVTYAAGPARDFYLAGSEVYNSRSASAGPVTLNCYYPPGRESAALLALDVAKKALETFGSRVGAYPYTELDIVSLDLLSGASGIEYPGIIGVDMDLLVQTASLEATVAHEIGHQWFYNIVGNDQINEPWLDEAMTQYITGLYYLEAHGEAGWQSQKQNWTNRWSRVAFADIPIGLPAGSYQGVEYSAIIYGRGPLFVDALAARVGAEVFSRFLQQYLQRNKWQIVSTAIFMSEAEAACSCELDALFEEWVLP